MLRFVNGRIELVNVYGEVLAAYPPESISEEEQAEGVEPLPVDPQTKAAFDRYRSGDPAAANDLGAALGGFNRQTATALQQAAQTGGAAPGGTTSRPSETVGVLQTPAWLNAQLNVAELALNGADAEQKFNLKIDGLIDSARRVGMTLTREDVEKMLAAPGAGTDGGLPATPEAVQMRLNSAQANDPDYINYIARLGGVTLTAEINRRQNILDRLAQDIEKQGRAADLNQRVGAGSRARGQAERNWKRAWEKARSDPNVSQEELNRMFWEHEDELLAAQEEEDALIEAERPGYIAWKEEGARRQVEALPPEQRAAYVGEGRPDYRLIAAGLRDVPAPPTDRDPNNLNMKVPTNLGAAQPTAPPGPAAPNQPPGAPAALTPPGPAPQGQHWVQENGQWVLRPIEEEDDLTTVPTFSLGGLYTPRYAEGGEFGFGTGGGIGLGDFGLGSTGPGQIGVPTQETPPSARPQPAAPPPDEAAPPQGEPGAAPATAEAGSAATPPGATTVAPNPAIAAERDRQLEAIAKAGADAEREASYAVFQIQQQAQAEFQSFQQQREQLVLDDQGIREDTDRRHAQVEQSYQEALAGLTQQLRQLETQQRQVIAQNPYAMGQFGRLELPAVNATNFTPGGLAGAYANPAPGGYTSGRGQFADIAGDPRVQGGALALPT